ncbi:thermonuclease family protein [Paeniglutamicibacter psychrophenolicus]|uniref:thermonuclease family protein n=1 Tax=Paeniglutamicibacter psychrophenolicus TaxID=257454 RepID=UPI002785B6A4|nr:thermonuclease family protein [Paeniglutamicibacter psychrophenolicus]MDQ0096048.1 micrococcal nuclease [Paeniglutamicibacter psychrophenolicus]
MAVLGFVATGCTQAPPAKSASDGSGATVVRVIDGDTIVADLSGTETTVRLLNIDTPETKHPDKPVQCLGAEATEFTKSLLAPGDRIELAYDVSRLDPYGRTLAGVYKDGSLVNADIAAAGLGVAVLFQPNERFYAEVLAAEQQAQDGGKGLFGTDVACTVPAMAQDAIAGLEALEDTVPAGVEAVGSALGIVAAAIVAGKAKSAALQALDGSGDAVRSAVWASRKATYLPLMSAAMDRAASIEKKLSAKESALVQAKKEAAAKQAAKVKAEAKAKAKAAAVAKAQAQAKAEAKRKAAAKATAERQAAAKRAAERKAAERRRQAAPKKTYRAPVQKSRPKSGGGSYSGYTGPRCYAPGGKSWKPC